MKVQANGVSIEVDRRGSGPPVLMLMGIGAQLILWDERFCDALGPFEVVRMDNRDIGLSDKLDRLGLPDPTQVALRVTLGMPSGAPYTLDDMADDAAGVIDALGMGSAHVIGASMGGMIAQRLAIRHPEKVRRTVLIMTGHGSRRHLGSPRAYLALTSPAPRTADEAGKRIISVFEVIGSPMNDIMRQNLYQKGKMAFERCHHPPGFARQLAAILAMGNWEEDLGRLRSPTLVIHGAQDPLIPPSAGRSLAARIPGAKLMVLEGMAHDLPPSKWPEITGAIRAHLQG